MTMPWGAAKSELVLRRRLKWSSVTHRPWLYDVNAPEGAKPFFRINYIVVRDEKGDVVGTGVTNAEAWEFARETYYRRKRAQND